MVIFRSYVSLPEGIGISQYPSQGWTACRLLAPGLPGDACAGFTYHNLQHISQKKRGIQQVTGWWYTYPSEKY
jgi:hypothetical protein